MILAHTILQSHPQLLDQLGKEFRKSSYDLKQLITWITLSRPYNLSAVLGSYNEIDDPSIGEMPKFSAFLLAADDRRAAVPVDGHRDRCGRRRQLRRAGGDSGDSGLQQFVVAFGTDEGDEATTFNGSIPQALMLFNGELTKNATSTAKGSFIDRIAAGGARDGGLSRLFLTGLARLPTKNEMKVASQLLVARGGKHKEMLQDMWWAILNSNEFIMQH